MTRSPSRPLAVALVALGLGAACKVPTRIDDRPVVLYSPAACAIQQDTAYTIVYGNGDFESAATPVANFYLRDTGIGLDALPPYTRALTADVIQTTFNSLNAQWSGTSEIPADGPINILMWPTAAACRLSLDVEPRTDGLLGTFGTHVMVAGGTLAGSVPHTYVGDLSTGLLAALPIGLQQRRSRASITAFSTTPGQEPLGALVAGGEDPASSTPLSTAEVYVPDASKPGAIGDFVSARIDLSESRTRHGAVALSNGDVLLVGGLGQFNIPLATMEIVNHTTRRAQEGGVALLHTARINPTVIRLASGEILVAGGVDRTNTPVTELEWFTPDASAPSKRSRDLVAGVESAIVPLEAGGALAVVIPEDQTATNNVWVISADGTLDAGTPINPTTLDKVRLFPGSSGAPVLWTGQQWQKWQPWAAAFQPIASAPTTGPTLPTIVNGDTGLALWLDDTTSNELFVAGFRFDTESRFEQVPTPLLVTGTLFLAPDRIASTVESAVRYDDATGLQLGFGASAFVTDVTFANVTASVDTATRTAIVLRQDDGTELSVGGAECPYAQPPAQTLRVERTGTVVRYSIDNGALQDCPTQLEAGTRVRIGLRGAESTGTTIARNLQITRR